MTEPRHAQSTCSVCGQRITLILLCGWTADDGTTACPEAPETGTAHEPLEDQR